MNLMEATIFAILISTPPGNMPYGCRLTDNVKEAICTNGLVIREFADGTLEYNAKIRVSKNRRRELIFSNGITANFDSFGWLQFSNGYAVRRVDGDIFRVAQPQGPELTCRYSVPVAATRCTPS
jgi:hypothetical protein